MTSRLLFACALVAVTVTIHAVSLGALLRALKPRALRARELPAISWLLTRVAWSLVFVHFVEISIWGLFYLWQGCLPDAESAFYFSGTAYTTIGFGDLVLPKPWRMFGPVEGLTGILMCGLSAGLFVALVGNIFGSDPGEPS